MSRARRSKPSTAYDPTTTPTTYDRSTATVIPSRAVEESLFDLSALAPLAPPLTNRRRVLRNHRPTPIFPTPCALFTTFCKRDPLFSTLCALFRQCRNWVPDPREMFCHRHLVARPNGPDDFALQLLNRSCNFQNAQGIHDSLQRLYTLLAADLISPRRAAVLGYLTSLLLRTLPAQYNNPYPQAGTPMSAAQLAERAKPKSLAPPALEAAAPTAKPVITDKPDHQLAAQPSPEPTTHPSPANIVAVTPLPAPTPTTSSPPVAALAQTTTETPPEPANQPPGKKRYEVRVPTTVNWHITGSPPPWGWTTDP